MVRKRMNCVGDELATQDGLRVIFPGVTGGMLPVRQKKARSRS